MRGVRLPEPELVADLVARLGGHADEGASGRRVARVVSPHDAEHESDLVVVISARFVDEALRRPGIQLISAPLASRFARDRRWVHEHAEWALAELLSLAEPARGPREVAQGACVEPGAIIAEDVALGHGAVIHAGARIGRGSSIGSNAVIYGGVTIGERVSVGPLAVLGRPGFGWVTGPGGRTRRMPQLGGVIIEDDVELGPLVTVDGGTLGPTLIRAGAKLDAHVHVGHNVEIGPGCLIAAQAGFAGSVRLGSAVWVGGQVGVKDHASVGSGARLAAKSGVVGDVPAGAVVAGFPAVAKATWLRAMAKLYGRRDEEQR